MCTMGWLTPFGLAIVGLVVAAAGLGTVGFGTSEGQLLVTVGCVAYAIAAVIFLLWVHLPMPVVVGLLLIMAGAAATIRQGDPSGPVVGLYLGIAFAPLRLPTRTALVTAIVAVAIFDAQLLATAPNKLVFTLVVTGGAAFFFLFGLLLDREQRQRRRIADLLARLAASTEAERTAAVLRERSRLAREVHDVLAHTLSGLILQLDGARLLARDHPGDPRLGPTIERAYGLARDGLGEARQAIVTLRGDALPGPELVPGLVDRHRDTDRGEVRLVVRGDPVPMTPDARLAVYRAAQEALSNVRRHAPGATVEVLVDWSPAGFPGTVLLRVENGPGRVRDPRVGAGSGYGLAGMAERAQALGGALVAEPTADAGFRVELRIPVAGESS